MTNTEKEQLELADRIHDLAHVRTDDVAEIQRVETDIAYCGIKLAELVRREHGKEWA